MVKMCVRNKIRVRTTDAYRMRLPKDGDGDLSQGRMGIIMKIDKHPDGDLLASLSPLHMRFR